MSPDEREERLEQARDHVRSNRPQPALQTLESIPIEGPADAEALNLSALANLQLGNGQQAEQLLRRALSLMPHHPEVLTNLAQHLSQQQRNQEAIELLREALVSRPDHPVARTGRGILDPDSPDGLRDLKLVETQGLQVPPTAAALARSHLILDELYAHRRSLELGVGVDLNDDPQPIYTYPLLEYLRQFDYSNCRILEWGSGNSTRWWAQRAATVIAIEHDPKWVARLRLDSPNNVQLMACETVSEYVDCFLGQPEKFDVVIVDGLYRFDCAVRAPDYLTEDGLVILDNSDWHPEAARTLRERDLLQVDFAGFKPTHDDVQTTSIFLSRNHRPKRLFDAQPLSPIGSHFLRKRWDRSYRA